QRLAGELRADELVALPLAAVEAAVGGGHLAGQRQEQGDGVLGGADGVAAGGVHDDDALARGGGDIDVIDADAGADDGPQFARVVEQLGRHQRLAADDDSVGGADGLLKGGALQAVALVEFDAGLAEQVEAGGFELVADEDAWHVWLPAMRRTPAETLE